TAADLAGYFAAYHVYPYYPDFIDLDPGYGAARSAEGPSHYFGYLLDLRRHHAGRPVLVAEYGVPSSRGVSHLQTEGMHHGRRDARARRGAGPMARVATPRAQRHGRLAGRGGSVLPVPRARRRTWRGARLDALRRRHRDAARVRGRAEPAGCVGGERCGFRVRASPERYERRTTPRGAGVQCVPRPT